MSSKKSAEDRSSYRIRARKLALEQRVALKMEALEHRLLAAIHSEVGSVRTELAAQTRTFMVATVGAVVSTGALAFAAARLT